MLSRKIGCNNQIKHTWPYVSHRAQSIELVYAKIVLDQSICDTEILRQIESIKFVNDFCAVKSDFNNVSI